MRCFISLAAAVGAVAATTAAARDAPSQFVFGGDFDTKFQVNSSRPEGGRRTENLWNETNLAGYINVGEHLSFNGAAKYERHKFNNADNFFIDHDAFLEDHGLTLRQLYSTVSFHPVSIYGGKIHPKFGSGFEETPGIFQPFSTDYEQDERLGFGAAVELPEMFGRSAFSAEVFKLDTTFLSEAAFSRLALDDPQANRVKRLRRSLGGASNTNNLDSYTLALRGKDIADIDGLKYQVSYTSEGVGQPGESRESGVSFGGSYEIKLSPRLGLTPYVEYAAFRNLGGAADQRDRYLTAAAALTWSKWTLAPAVIPHRITTPDGTTRDLQYSISLIRDLEIIDGLSAGIGFNHVRVADRDSDTIGVMVSYARSF
ncbi:MAG: hypothetical protein HY246_21460 [Proteobacteria bacterium]|nr:hypothetical protein [Pseudomonadota bacterium]